MAIFWTLATVMILVALLVVMKALLLPAGKRVMSGNVELSVFRARLDELEQDVNNGIISEEDANAARKEMEYSLLRESRPGTAPADTNSGNINKSGEKITAFIIAVALPIFAISMYLFLGQPELLTKQTPSAKEPVADSMPADHPPMDKMVIKLAERLKQEPDDAEGWWTLANTYMSMQRFSDAVDAMEHLYVLAGDDPRVLLRYADALVMANDGRFAGKPAELIEKALALEPENILGLWLAGMAAREQGKYREAVGFWHRLLPKLENDPQSRQEVIKIIRSVQQNPDSDLDMASVSIEQGANETGLPSLTVEVSLAPEFSEQTHPDDILFVYAKAIEGPPMPVAIVRKKVSGLPLEVILDDSSAIMPTNKLSGYDTVNIGARISKSGQATPQSGDLESDTITAKPGSKETIKLVIRNRVP